MAVITGTNQTDFLFGTSEDDTVSGLGGDDSLFGGGGNDLVLGGERQDFLFGAIGDDELQGGGGADDLLGDLGQDTLTGGAGGDVMIWRVALTGFPESAVLAPDLVTDFQGAGLAGGDAILLENDIDPATGRGAPFVFMGATDVAPEAGAKVGFSDDGFTQVFTHFDGADTFLIVDVDDDGALGGLDLVVRFAGEQDIDTGDFTLTQFATLGGPGRDLIEGTGAVDLIFGLGDRDTLAGRGGDDSISAGAGADVVSGGAGRDIILGDAGADLIVGGSQDDRISGDDGDDSLAGQGGDDDIHGFFGDDVITGGADEDALFGDQGHDRLDGGALEDLLSGGFGDDTILGGGGADLIIGDFGADVMTGGFGVDTFSIAIGQFFRDSFLADPDIITDFEGGGAKRGDLIDINASSLVYRGETSTAPAEGATIEGGGNGLVDVAYWKGPSSSSGATGSLWLMADRDDDGVLDPNDFVLEMVGVASLTKGDFGPGTNFAVAGTEGDDTLRGVRGGDTIFGFGGDDRIRGSNDTDEIFGGDGADTVTSGGGFSDFLHGGDGDDLLVLGFTGFVDGDDGNDVIRGGAEFSVLNGNAGDDVITAGDGQAAAHGNEGDDLLSGGAAVDDLRGDAGSDTIDGGAGDDNLFGGPGDDTVTGGAGHDIFNFEGGAFDPSQSTGSDLVTDFIDGEDQLFMLGLGPNYDTVEEVMAAAAQDGDDTVFTLTGAEGGDATVRLQGFDFANLDTSDFAAVF